MLPVDSPPHTLRRSLTLRDLVVFGLLFIGPLAPVGVFGVLDAKANGAVALVYVLATLAMACTAWSYAQMSRVVPHAGSVFAYAGEGLGRTMGFMAGWMVMLDYLLIPAVAYLFSGIALHALYPVLPAWLFTALAFMVATLLNISGVGVAARAGRLVLVAEIAVLIVFVVSAIIVLMQHGPLRDWATPFTGVRDRVTGTTTSIAAIAGATSIAVLSFLGFDAIASFAEESAGDARQVGKAIVFCLLVAGAVFVVQAYLAGVLSVTTPASLAATPAAQGTAFYDIARSTVGAWLATTLAITKAIGPAFAAMTGQAAAARLLLGMARDGRLPRALSRIDAQRGVPTVALSVIATLTFVVAVWAARRDDGLSVLVSIVDVGALTAFTLLHASVIGYFVVQKRAAFTITYVVVPIVGALVTAWVLLEASVLAQIVGGVWCVIGVVALVATRRPAGRQAA